MANAYTANEDLAVVRHARALYDALLAESKVEQNIAGEDLIVFRGAYGKVYDSLGISRTYYGPIKRLFVQTGSVEFLQAAGNGRSTLVVLRHAPTDEDIQSVDRDTLTKRSEAATVELVARVEDSLKRLEAWREGLAGLNIPEAFRDHELRILALEARSVTPATPALPTTQASGTKPARRDNATKKATGTGTKSTKD